ncbi:hypothetical protein LCGC14_1109910 [marine sediment metagenome]|uniref:Uncharacterized protein n=1 Tax=marine sediment metagenome TaxID=412755 RepID=A0A0F9MUX3_9ZZZZ
MGDTLFGFILGVILGVIFGLVIFKDSYRDDLCQEQFAHAETVADTLTIIHNDTFCLDFSKAPQ